MDTAEQPPISDYEPVSQHSGSKKIWIAAAIIFAFIVALLFFLLRRDSEKQDNLNNEAPPTFRGVMENDKDGDGITAQEEEALGTNDWEFDSDGDGLSDKLEKDVWKTDPKILDSDGDGTADGYEVLEGTDPLKPDAKTE